MKKLITAIILVSALAANALAQCNPSCSLNPPGLPTPLIDWRFVNSGSLPQTHGVFLKEDAISIKVESGAGLNLTPDEMEIVLTSSVSWRKELVSFSACAGRTGMIATQGSNQGPVSMRLNRTNCRADTILLRKEKAFQGMVDMYHLDPARFWRLWAGKIITINWSSDWHWGKFPPVCNFPCVPVDTDVTAGALYDTDSKADIAVFRPHTGEWFVINSSTGNSFSKQLGNTDGTPVPFDYDGDGRTDMGFWNRNTGNWSIINSLTGQTRVVQWGLFGDMPAPGDYDGDGKADLAVWRPSDGTWYIKGYITGAQSTVQGGTPSDLQVAADYDGDRKTDPAVWNMFSGVWTIYTNPQRTMQWGTVNDVRVPGDYNGNGTTDYGVLRNGVWLIKNIDTGEQSSIQLGWFGDQPVPKDYNGDGKTDYAVFRPWTSEWWIKTSPGAVETLMALFGGQGDIPVPSK